MINVEAAVLATTIATFIMAIMLAALMTKRYLLKGGQLSHMFWAMGLWVFAFTVLMEAGFATGLYSETFVAVYLFLVVALVQLLSLGSLQLVVSAKIKRAYYAYCLVVAVFVLYSVLSTNIGNIMSDYVVFGNLPLPVVVSSSLATFPAAVLMIVMAWRGYKKTKSARFTSIISGVVIVSIAGTLYIAQIPEFLYASEFIGILLLWYGFIK